MDEQQHYLIVKIKELADSLQRVPLISEFQSMLPRVSIEKTFGTYDNLLKGAGLLTTVNEPKFEYREPRLLTLDIETKPLKVWSWGLWEQNISLDMIIEDWSILSIAFKWVGNDEVFYYDVSKEQDICNDFKVVHAAWEALNHCDVLITQNGKKFDEKKLNAKFEQHGLGAPLPYRHIDTLQIKKKKFALTSNKLEYSTNKFNEKYKKLKHAKFSGMSLWLECMKGNPEAWAEMKEYNIHDVLALEELYINHLRHWDKSINFGAYTGAKHSCPRCGSADLIEKEKLTYTNTGAFQNYQCKNCKSYSTSKHNELSPSTRKNQLK